MPTATPTSHLQHEFVRLQLEADTLLNLPQDQDLQGDTGPADIYFALGKEWTRYLFTGSFFTVREYMRADLQPFADPALTLDDCVDGMAHVVERLRTSNANELAKAADGAMRARRQAHQDAASGAERTAMSPTSMTPRPAPDPRRQYLVRLNAASGAIEAMRPKHNPNRPSEPLLEQTQNLRLLSRAWAVYYVTGLAYVLGGPQSEAMASVADPSLDPEKCINGLRRIRKRITKLGTDERRVVFAGIDTAFAQYVPEFDFNQ